MASTDRGGGLRGNAGHVEKTNDRDYEVEERYIARTRPVVLEADR